jgi:DtxR family Mn-dependent transcriptional regulator
MLGHPATDPHGDPIPSPEGALTPQPVQSLMTCPLHTPVTVTRVIDQGKEFLRFVESQGLKPGRTVTIEQRDAASDSVALRRDSNDALTIGARAASKLLVVVER